MLRASAGSSEAWLSVTIRLIVRSQFSGVARRYEILDMRPLSSLRWQDPHLARTRSLCTGMPSLVVASGAAGVCARAGTAAQINASPAYQPITLTLATALRSVMENPLGNQQRQTGDDIRQRHRAAGAAVVFEDVRNAGVTAGDLGQPDEVDVAGKSTGSDKCVLEHDLVIANHGSRLDADVRGQPQVHGRGLLESFERGLHLWMAGFASVAAGIGLHAGCRP